MTTTPHELAPGNLRVGTSSRREVAFTTGVARGQGRSHALRFAERGVDVIGIDLCRQLGSVPHPLTAEDDLQATITLVKEAGGHLFADAADVRDRASMQQVPDDGLRVFGRLDYVVANAGIPPAYASGRMTSKPRTTASTPCSPALCTRPR